MGNILNLQGKNLRQILFASFISMSLLIVLAGLAWMGFCFQIKRSYLSYDRQRQCSDLLGRLAEVFEGQERTMNSYLIGIEPERERWRIFETEMEQTFARWEEAAPTALEKNQARNLKKQYQSFRLSMEDIFLLGRSRRKEAVQKMESEGFEAMDHFRKRMSAAAALVEKSCQDSRIRLLSLAERAVWVSGLILFSIVLTGLGLSLFLSKIVSKPLANLRDEARRLGEGQWDLNLEVDGPVEMQELATSFRQMAFSLKNYESRIVQADRMAATGTLGAGVAHEINSPLTGILGQAQILLDLMDPSEPYRTHIEKIERAAQKCRKIISDLLQFSHPHTENLIEMELEVVIAGSLSLFRSSMVASGITIEWDRNPDLPKVKGNPALLQQVFVNILTNAAQAMPNGGKLRIACSPCPPRGPGFSGSSVWVETRITDSGTGIDKKILPRIFDPFFTTREPGKGAGLGLTIAWEIMQRHGGAIEARSGGTGRGTTFSVALPALPVQVQRTAVPFEALENRLTHFEGRHP